MVTFKGKTISISGTLPKVGAQAPDFTLVKQNLEEATLNSYSGKIKVLNIFPSLDTSVCANTVRKFNKELENAIVLNISLDLPFAQERFCTSEGLKNVETLSAFRSSFGEDYGLVITDGPLKGLFSRVVIVLDKNNKIIYTEQVKEITQEPDYTKVFQICDTLC